MSATTTNRGIQIGEDVKLDLTLTEPSEPIDKNVPTLLFLHFWGGSSSSFSSVIDNLSPYFPTAALSFRGWGNSSGPDDIEAYTVAHYCSDVEAVIETLGLKSVVLVAHSMGGKVAMAVAGRHNVPKDILKGLCLIAPAPPGPLALADPNMREQQLHAFDNIENAEVVVRNVLTASDSGLSDAVVRSITDDMVRGSKAARNGWLVHGMPEDIGALFDRVDVPVWVVAGGSDIIEPVERMRTEIQEKLNARSNGSARLVVVEGSGHLLPFEKPNEVAEYVKQFVEVILQRAS
jgi:pimeloyl-ACP methyl ester carboxylesterase